MAQVLLKLEDIQRVFGIVEHRCDGGSCAMARDPLTAVLIGNACFLAQIRNEKPINVVQSELRIQKFVKFHTSR